VLSQLLNAALKGLLEGLTEFLPVSSTGHLILVRDWLPLTTDPADAERLNRLFDVVIQLPAILAIVVLYRARLWDSVRELPRQPAARRFWLGLLAAFVPAAVVGLLCHHWIEEHLERPLPVALALLTGGLALIIVERWLATGETGRAEDVPLGKSVSIGFFQILAVLFPGTSRSGACIVGGRFLGLDRTAAAEYSFFLALPTMFAACGYKLLKELPHMRWESDLPVLLVGGTVAFVSALAVVALFIRFLQKHSLAVFGWYRIALAALVLAALWQGWIKSAS
jgi:undecaprenyl-diphosphatase